MSVTDDGEGKGDEGDTVHQEADIDGDGTVNYEEFVTALFKVMDILRNDCEKALQWSRILIMLSFLDYLILLSEERCAARKGNQ